MLWKDEMAGKHDMNGIISQHWWEELQISNYVQRVLWVKKKKETKKQKNKNKETKAEKLAKLEEWTNNKEGPTKTDAILFKGR